MKNALLCSLILFIFSFTNIRCAQQKPANETAQQIAFSQDHTLAALPVKADALLPETTPAKITETTEYFEQQKPKQQSFIIDPANPVPVNCKGGTTITFVPGVFMYADTKETVSGDVEVKVTEFLCNADIIFAELQTKSGKRMLETGGMIYIEASANGRECAIREGSYYSIEIPAWQNKEGMQTFYGVKAADGNDGRVDWVAAQYASGNKTYTNVNNQQTLHPVFDGGIVGLYTYLHDNISLPEGAENITLLAHKKILLTFVASGEIIKVQPDPAVKTYIDTQLSEALKYSPCWEMPAIEKGSVRLVEFPFSVNWIRDPALIPTGVIVKDRVENENYSAFFNMNSYLMAAGQLGWINCDRFYDNTKERVDMFVMLDNTTDTKVNLIFKNMRGFIAGEKFKNGYLFRGVPAGEESTIVALRIKEEKLELAVKECITAAIDIHDLHFKIENIGSVRAKLNNMGDLGGAAMAAL